MNEELKPLVWVGSSQKDVRSFPEPVRSDIGYALYAAQRGETDPAAKPLKGFGGHAVMEIVAPFDGNTWRTVYTVRGLRAPRFPEEVQVGHRNTAG